MTNRNYLTYRRVAFRDQATNTALAMKGEIERDCLDRHLTILHIEESRSPWHLNPEQVVEISFTVTVEPMGPSQESLLHLAWEQGFNAGFNAGFFDSTSPGVEPRNPYARGPA